MTSRSQPVPEVVVLLISQVVKPFQALLKQGFASLALTVSDLVVRQAEDPVYERKDDQRTVGSEQAFDSGRIARLLDRQKHVRTRDVAYGRCQLHFLIIFDGHALDLPAQYMMKKTPSTVVRFVCPATLTPDSAQVRMIGEPSTF